jgi:hypothetical protein
MDDLTTVTTDDGRVLGVIEMDPADQLDLFEACGDLSTNQQWVGMALLACSVRSINGVPVPQPANKLQVRALAKQLGKKGIAAVAKFLGEKQADAPEVVAAAKN